MKQHLIIAITFLSFNVISNEAYSMGRGRPVSRSQVDMNLLKDGDILFIQSQTEQAAALREATGSVWTHVGILVKEKTGWYVAEAIGPLKMTPIKDFIGRSKNRSFEVYRFKYFDAQTMKVALLNELTKYNKPYDIFFEWSEDRIYCSELTYKVFMDVTGHEMGTVQKMKEMRLDGPYVQALIEKRLTDIGKELNLEEPIVSPVSQMMDEDMNLTQRGSAK